MTEIKRGSVEWWADRLGGDIDRVATVRLPQSIGYDWIEMSISLPHFLATMLDTEEVVEALDEIYRWWTEFVNPGTYYSHTNKHKDENKWFAEWFTSMVGIRNGESDIDYDTFFSDSYRQANFKYNDERTEDEWMVEARTSFPWDKLEIVAEDAGLEGGLHLTSSHYTGNSENDFDHDFSYVMFSTNPRHGDIYDDDFVLIEGHFFRFADVEYFYSWCIEFWCDSREGGCEHHWEMRQFYANDIEDTKWRRDPETGESVKEIVRSPYLIDEWYDLSDDEIELMQRFVDAYELREVAQYPALPGMEFDPPSIYEFRVNEVMTIPLSVERVQEILAEVENDREKGYDPSIEWTTDEAGWARINPDDLDSYGPDDREIEMAHAQFRCPLCGKWAVAASTMAYGY